MKRLSLIFVGCLCIVSGLYGQNKYSLFISSDIGNDALGLEEILAESNHYVVLNGGISRNTRINSDLSASDLSKKQRKRLFIHDGANEWNGGGINGYQNIRALDDQLDKSVKVDFVIGKGCAGPEAKVLDEDNVLLFISSSWFLHPHYKPIFSSTDCDFLYAEDIWSELEDLVEKHADKNIFLFAYHSKKQDASFTFKDIFIPHNGPAYSENSKAYKDYAHHLEEIVDDHKNVYFISGNQKATSFLSTHEGIELNAKRSQTKEWLRIDIDQENSVRAIRVLKEEEVVLFESEAKLEYVPSATAAFAPLTDSVVVVASENYQQNAFAKFWLGENFRKEWSCPVKVPVLDITTFEGGLVPYAVGGGMQTNSLKFKTKDGRKFAFRSVDKDTRKDKSLPVMKTVVGAVKQDQISSQLPFGDIFMGKLLDYSDILHVTPKAYVMGDQAALGPYRERFANVLATVEEKPQGKNKTEHAFADADKIFTSHQVYRALLKDNENRIDGLSFAKATLFSIWVADWDRHQDNFKWAGYKEDKAWVFKPIPRDRDHVLALWEGVIGNLSDLLTPNVAELRPSIGNVKYLTFQGKSLQQFVAARITKEEWEEAATYLMQLYDEEKIRAAWKNIPTEIQTISRERIVDLLLSRKKELLLASHQVHSLYQNNLDVYLTDKGDYVELVDNTLFVYDKKKEGKGKSIFSKKIVPGLNNSVNIYCLGGSDIIDLSKAEASDIKIRIVAGPGNDVVVWPNQSVSHIEVYDFDQQDQDEKIHKTHRPVQPNLYDFNYNSLLPIPILVNNSDLGTGVEIKLQSLTQLWNKRPYGIKHNLGLRFFPSTQSLRFSYKLLYRELINNWHGDLNLRAAFRDTHFDHYTGINTTVPTDFVENQRIDRPYYLKNNNYDVKLGLRRDIYGLSRYQSMIGFQQFSIEDDLLEGITLELIDQTDNVQLSWYNHLDLNFMDDKNYPSSGARYRATGALGYTLSGEKGVYYTLDLSALRAVSWTDISKTIVLVKGGWKQAGGETRFFNIPTLGNRQDLRGNYNNILRAEQVAYFNSEIRKEVWDSENSFLPFVLGLSGYYDRALSSLQTEGDFQTSYGYGGGAYFSLLNKQYTLFFSIGESNLISGAFFDMGLDFRFE